MNIAEIWLRNMNERTVLLVECDEAQLSLLGELIATGGYTVVSCHDFDSARRYLQTHTPWAVVTDVRLGPFNGLHLVLLAKQTAPAITAIVYSGKEDSGIRREAALGGASYLEKETLRGSLLPHLGAHGATESEEQRAARAQSALPDDAHSPRQLNTAPPFTILFN